MPPQIRLQILQLGEGAREVSNGSVWTIHSPQFFDTASVNDSHSIGNGDGRLCNIGCKNHFDLSGWRRFKNWLLIFKWDRRVQLDHFHLFVPVK